MKVKKSINHILFFDVFFGSILVILVSLGFFLGFDITKNNLLVYFFINLSIVVVCVLVYVLYMMFCSTYYIFTENEIIIAKKQRSTVLIEYNQIHHAEYYKFYKLLLGDSKGGTLIVFCVQENKPQQPLEISLSLKLTKKIPFKVIIK